MTDVLPDDQIMGPGAKVIMSLLETELKGEDARKTSIEGRAAGVITTSGTLVTLLFGLVAIITKLTNYQAPTSSVFAILAALVLFVAAAVVALLATDVKTYQRVDLEKLDKTVKAELHTITERRACNLVACRR